MTTPPPRIPAPAPVERACRCAWDEASSATLDPAEQTALAALGQWLEEPDRPYAILHGPRASRRAIVACQEAEGDLARHDPAHAPELTRRALSLALHLGADEPDRLLELLPLARHFPVEGAVAALGLLLDALAGDYRHAALAGDGVSLVKLAPLIAALAGDEGLAGAAREVVQVAAWFP